MSSFTFVSSAARTDSGETSAQDCSAAAVLRFAITFASINLGKAPDASFVIYDSPSGANGTWREISRQQIAADRNWPADNVLRFSLGSFQQFVKVAWLGNARANTAASDPTIGWTFGIAATGAP